jgi:hypothetical protein
MLTSDRECMWRLAVVLLALAFVLSAVGVVVALTAGHKAVALVFAIAGVFAADRYLVGRSTPTR